ncbi:MAG: CAP domain-containing protein [Sandaracinaceae bacterium]|nr:CAP domain-containing protein [Sandaracinaceae bacterium]
MRARAGVAAVWVSWAVAALGGCAADASGGPSCEPSDGAEVCEVFRLVNEARAREGLAPYTYDRALGLAAQLHAEDMVEQGYFSHDSLDGRSFADRARDAGYDASARGENIASGQRSAAQVMESWMGSSGHRANILSTRSNEIGIGLHQNRWVQVFGQRALVTGG